MHRMGPTPLGIRLALAALAVGVVVGCGSSTPGHTVRTVAGSGGTRSWNEYRPPGLPVGPVPLVVVLHGLGETPTAIARTTGIDALARRDGFVVAYPAGVGKSWDAGTCCGVAAARHTDDVDFIAGVVANLVGSGRVDARRVFVLGFSNGAMMAWDLACERPGLIAGVAEVEGTLTGSCPVHRPRDLLVVHQRDDAVIPFGGTPTPDVRLGDTAALPPVETGLARWLGGERCTTPPAVVPSTLVQPFERDTYDCPGPSRTELVLLDGGTHVWPRLPDSAVDGAALVTAFFGLAR